LGRGCFGYLGNPPRDIPRSGGARPRRLQTTTDERQNKSSAPATCSEAPCYEKCRHCSRQTTVIRCYRLQPAPGDSASSGPRKVPAVPHADDEYVSCGRPSRCAELSGSPSCRPPWRGGVYLRRSSEFQRSPVCGGLSSRPPRRRLRGHSCAARRGGAHRPYLQVFYETAPNGRDGRPRPWPWGRRFPEAAPTRSSRSCSCSPRCPI
jgi:hypothetical protein